MGDLSSIVNLRARGSPTLALEMAPPRGSVMAMEMLGGPTVEEEECGGWGRVSWEQS